jgi:hypothetical protein
VDSSKTLLRRIAGFSAILAVLIGGLSGVLFLVAGGFRLDWLLDPGQLLGVGSSRAQLPRWGALTDMFGYYLLLVPLFVGVGSELRPEPARSLTCSRSPGCCMRRSARPPRWSWPRPARRFWAPMTRPTGRP